MVLPTIRYAMENKARSYSVPTWDGRKEKGLTNILLAPVAQALSAILDKPYGWLLIVLVQKQKTWSAAMQDGDIVLLENLRYHAEEQANDPEFSRQLASLADVYINDAFAVSHRAHASVVGVPENCQEKAAGFLLQKEMEYFHVPWMILSVPWLLLSVGLRSPASWGP